MPRLRFFPLLALVLALVLPPAWAQVPQEQSPPEQTSPTPPAQTGTSFGFGYDAPLSFWLEAGGLYRTREGELTPHLRATLRGIKPLSETVALYTALGLDGGLGIGLDAGAWYSFLPGADDLFGFRAYGGAGLSYIAGSFGLALSAAASYELSIQTSLVLVYTHRPLFLPTEGQAFDVSLGVSYTLPQ